MMIFCCFLPWCTKNGCVYGAIFTLKKNLFYVIMPEVVSKGYKFVIFGYNLAILIVEK